MKKVIITLIAVQTKVLFAGMLLLESPQNYVEIDPVVINQPAKRLFIGNTQETKKNSISYHRQLIQKPYKDYLTECQVFLESKFPVKSSKLGSTLIMNDLPVDLFLIKGLKKDFDLEILQAYIPVGQEVFLLSMSVPQKGFHANLDIFKNFLNQVRYLASPIDEQKIDEKTALRAIDTLIKTEKIPIEKFLSDGQILKAFKAAFSIHDKDKLASKLLELRAYLYD